MRGPYRRSKCEPGTEVVAAGTRLCGKGNMPRHGLGSLWADPGDVFRTWLKTTLGRRVQPPCRKLICPVEELTLSRNECSPRDLWQEGDGLWLGCGLWMHLPSGLNALQPSSDSLFHGPQLFQVFRRPPLQYTPAARGPCPWEMQPAPYLRSWIFRHSARPPFPGWASWTPPLVGLLCCW